MNKDYQSLFEKFARIRSSDPGISAYVLALLESLKDEFKLRRAFVYFFEDASGQFVCLGTIGINLEEYRKLEQYSAQKVFSSILENDSPYVLSKKQAAQLPFSYSMSDSIVIGATASYESKRLAVLGFEVDSRFGFDVEKFVKFCNVPATLIANEIRFENAVQIARARLQEENIQLRQELKDRYDFSQIVGNSGEMKQVYSQVSQVARSNATVLLRGESGTGKEMIANSIHYNSLRAKQPFVAVNCAALPEALVEAELFGHEKGAFTGADRKKPGRFELAANGTIFLDEIGDLPPQTQVKLLRVLQERKIERLGGTTSIDTNVRIIAATNRDLESEITNASFREDLFYRLNVFTIFLPPLRERKSDILLLAEHFVRKYDAEYGKGIKRLSTTAIDMLASYHYPGNVRELENAIERATIICDSGVIHGHHLPPTLQTAEVSDTVTSESFEQAVIAFEQDLINDALKSSRGNIAQAARMLNLTERVIGYKIKKYGIDAKRFKHRI
ncbi:MAG: sigma-54 interaction domain-containing protein [Pyrinomonadaceae bacterium]